MSAQYVIDCARPAAASGHRVGSAKLVAFDRSQLRRRLDSEKLDFPEYNFFLKAPFNKGQCAVYGDSRLTTKIRPSPYKTWR